jgi:uncharacterized protein
MLCWHAICVIRKCTRGTCPGFGGIALVSEASPLAIGDQARLLKLLEHRRGFFSECSFANLYLFREKYDYQLQDGSNPYLLGRSKIADPYVFPLAPLMKMEDWSEILRCHPCHAVYPVSKSELYHAPKGMAASFSPSDSDYLFRVSDLSTFKGVALGRIRNAINQLERKADIRCFPLVEVSPDLTKTVLQCWFESRSETLGAADFNECVEAIDQLSQLRLSGFLYLEQDTPIGFVITDNTRPNQVIVLFCKALPSYQGLYPYMLRDVARKNPTTKILNYCQDLGLPGLREAKRRLRPVSLAKKRVAFSAHLEISQ